MPARDICQVALHVFADKAYEAATLKEIADEAGVDPSLISYQFGSKLNLWKAVIEDLGRQLQALLAGLCSAADDEDPEGSLRYALSEITQFMCENPHIPHFVARDVFRDDERTEWVNGKFVAPLLEHLGGRMKKAQAIGRLRPGPPQMLIFQFGYGMAINIIRREQLVHSVPELADDEIFRSQLTDMLIGSVLRDG
ncbi:MULTISPECIES: TetR/AcrR family transcriptional regulator [Sphingobium]|uniref:TetR/AcrR family transcriptional regulator n=1 Tax=Sphingobium TaxID=165695 RepID=UPI00242DE60E|nr:TetR/AcrR family transcriptional regulator [Sphingobium yanoikuyae]